ncbi:MULTISPECIES: hypothetical protein [Robertmurraya]|uniref:Uncharacterized protein n=1 Tax=Robertmurraya beringensis TaxID=641660 RepID=A0ABV6KKR3_9BACI
MDKKIIYEDFKKYINRLYKSFLAKWRFTLTMGIWLVDRIVSFFALFPMLGFLFLVIAFLIFYFVLAPPVDKPVSPELRNAIYYFFDSIGFNHFGDITVRDIISRTTSSLGFCLSIISAIYVFTHREQKSVAPSASINSRKNRFVVVVLSIFLFTMFTGYTLVENYNASILQPDSLHISKILFSKILLWAIGIGWSIGNFIDLIKSLFESMSIDKMLRNSIRDTNSEIRLITRTYRHKYFNKFIDNRYRKLHYNIESVFQNLKYAADNNMNKEFEESVYRLANVINRLKSENKKYNIDNLATYLLEQDKKSFIDLYNSLLRNTLSLINHLYKNQHYRKGRSLVSLYFSIYVNGEGRLKQNFSLSLKEFLDSLDINNERQLRAFLDELGILSEEQTFITYKSLIMKLIIQNNVKMLTNIVYDFKENIIQKQQETKDIKIKALAQRKAVELEGSLIVILMQCLVKGIEISHYSATGFLIKYLVTNFKGTQLKKGFSVLQRNRDLFTKVLEQDKSLDNMSEGHKDFELITINKETFDYCCKKLCILLYGQQIYADNNNLWFVSDNVHHQDKIDLAKEFYDCTFSAYMIKKIESSSYGLLFLKDKEVMQDIYYNLGVPWNDKVLS